MLSYFQKKKIDTERGPQQQIVTKKKQISEQEYQEIAMKAIMHAQKQNWNHNMCFKKCLQLNKIVLSTEEDNCLKNCTRKQESYQKQYQDIEKEFIN